MPEKQFMGAKDIAQTMECSLSFAYKLIKQMNATLQCQEKFQQNILMRDFIHRKGVIELVGAINSLRNLRQTCIKYSGSCKSCPLGRQMNINNTLCPHLTKPISWTDEKTTEMVRKIGG